MASENILSADDAVSSVISVILMVGVVVILGAVVSVFALGIAEGVDSTAPSASFEFKILNNGDIEVTHAGGNTLNGDQLRFAGAALEKTSFGSITEWSGDVTAGDSAAVDAEADETLTLIWQSPNSGETATLAEYNVPSSVVPTASIGSITAIDGDSKITINNIQFSKISSGDIHYTVEKCKPRRCHRVGSIRSGRLSDEGNLIVNMGRNVRGEDITVRLYETDDKSNELETAKCTVGSCT